MYTHANKDQQANAVAAHTRAVDGPAPRFSDQRPQAALQRKWQQMSDNSPKVQQLNAYQNLADEAAQWKIGALVQRQTAQSHSRVFSQPSTVPNGVIQRAIGFEFQLPLTNLWRFSPQRKDTEPLPDDFLPYGEKVFEHTGRFHVESDDGELEFVTAAFNEDKPGLDKMEQAVGGAANFAQNLLGFPNYPTTVARAKARYAGGKLLGEQEEVKSPRIGNRHEPAGKLGENNLSAKPQTTFGLTLENLAAFARIIQEKYSKMGEEELGKADTGTREMANAVPWAEGFMYDYAAVNHAYSDATEKAKNLTTLTVEFIRDSREEAICYQRYYDDALEHHTEDEMHYKPGEVAPILYPKSQHTLMVRNSFKSMFNLLDPIEKERCKKMLVDMRENYLQMNSDDLLYPHGYYSHEVKPKDYYTKGAEQHVVRGPKVDDWLGFITEEAPAKADLPLAGTPQDRGMGASTKMDEVPVTKAKAPVFELRAFQGPVMPREWVALAQTVHKIINEVQMK